MSLPSFSLLALSGGILALSGGIQLMRKKEKRSDWWCCMYNDRNYFWILLSGIEWVKNEFLLLWIKKIIYIYIEREREGE